MFDEVCFPPYFSLFNPAFLAIVPNLYTQMEKLKTEELFGLNERTKRHHLLSQIVPFISIG